MRMREICRKDGLHLPQFEEIGNFFRVTLYRPQIALNPDVREVYDLLKQRGPIASRGIAEHLNLHQNTALKRLKLLLEKGLIRRTGKGSNVRYEV